MDLASLRYETFVPRVGEIFRDTSSGAGFELVAVDQLEGSGDRSPFALTFFVPEDAAPRQGMRSLVHDELGELPIFVVPIDRNDAGARYHAVFT